MQLTFVTGNAKKFAMARASCTPHGIELVQLVLDIDEIQGEDPRAIIKAKAEQAYHLVNKPVVVSDDSWYIHALNGFPGPYMKSINHWFEPQDFLNLLRDKNNRRGMVAQLLAYYDGKSFEIFRKDVSGSFANDIRGTMADPIRNVFCVDGDNGMTLAEVEAAGLINSSERLARHPNPWDDFAAWLKKQV